MSIEFIPSDEYHARPEAGKSELDLVHNSIAKYLAAKAGDRAETPAMRVGRAFHMAVLEPRLYALTYAVMPPCDKRTKAGKEAAAEFEAANQGKTILSDEDDFMIGQMRLAIQAHPVADQLVCGGQAEASIFWHDHASGVDCKCRPDYLLEDMGMVIDLKSTEDASPNGFARSCWTYTYHAQVAHYLAGIKAHGLNIDQFLFVAVEKRSPYNVAVYTLDAEAVAAGEVYIRDALAKLADYRRRIAAGERPHTGYAPVIITLSLPRWAITAQEDTP